MSVYLQNSVTGDMFLIKTFGNPYYDELAIERIFEWNFLRFEWLVQIVYPPELTEWIDTFGLQGIQHSRMHCNREPTMTYNLFVNFTLGVKIDEITLDGTPVKCSIESFKKYNYIECNESECFSRRIQIYRLHQVHNTTKEWLLPKRSLLLCNRWIMSTDVFRSRDSGRSKGAHTDC